MITAMLVDDTVLFRVSLLQLHLFKRAFHVLHQDVHLVLLGGEQENIIV